jgi:hypothetical protein
MIAATMATYGYILINILQVKDVGDHLLLGDLGLMG